MKAYVIAFFCAFACFYPTKAQNEIDTADFFPMQAGNYWEFRASTIFGPLYYCVTVKGDTVMPNGRKYTCFREKDITPYRPGYYYFEDYDYYYRKDSNAVYRYKRDPRFYNNESRYFDFSRDLKDLTIWQVADTGNAAGNARGLVRTYFNNNYYSWFNRPVETKLFTDVRIDSIDTIWAPTDASIYCRVAKGKFQICFQCRSSEQWGLFCFTETGKSNLQRKNYAIKIKNVF